jgi:predicted permease
MSDLRATVRQLRQSPAHIAACLLSLAVGMAICVAVFSVVNAMVFAPIPGVRDRQHLVQIRWNNNNGPFTISEFEAIDAGASTTFNSIAAEGIRVLPLALPSGPASNPVAFASARYFETLGTRPVVGRLLGAGDSDSGAPPVAVISEGLWRQVFGGDPATLGRLIGIGGQFFTIVGIAPAGLSGLRLRDIGWTDADYPQVWLPLAHARSWMRGASTALQWLTLQGRLRSDVSLQAAQGELAVIGARLVTDATGRTKDSQIRAFRSGLDWNDAPGDSLLAMFLFLFVPLCVLAIGCANVISLQLARATERARELSVRLALGASRVQLARLLALEVVLLGVVAGAIGWRGAHLLLKAMQPLFPTPLSVDRRVLGFVFILVAGVVSLGGIAPAWFVTRDVLSVGLKEQAVGGSRQGRLRGLLVVFQVAACVALLFIAALAARSLQATMPIMSAEASHTLVTEFNLTDVHPGLLRTRPFIDAVEENLRNEPAVRSAGFADFFGSDGTVRYWLSGDDTRLPRIARGGLVTNGWFDSTVVTMLAGDGFRGGDSNQAFAVVNESMASAMGDPVRAILGRQLRVAHPESALVRSVEIVGVVSNSMTSVDGQAIPMIFLPMPQASPAALILTVRANTLDGAVRAAKAAVAKADPDVPMTRLESVEGRYDERFKSVRAMTWFGVELGLLALVLAAAGLYAVMAYTVRRWTREIGIRMAVGATLAHILALVLRQGLGLATLGVATGAVVAIPIAFLLRSVFFGISPVDPRALLATGGMLVAAVLAASAVPAYRAATVDPVVALRED